MGKQYFLPETWTLDQNFFDLVFCLQIISALFTKGLNPLVPAEIIYLSFNKNFNSNMGSFSADKKVILKILIPTVK